LAEEVTAVTEEYLEGIYRLQQRSGVARTSEMVELLQVVPGTVTNTIERLEREGLVTHEPYKGVKLTEEGRKIALDVIRRHRLSERLLTDILHMGWDEAHKAACRLEHGITGNIVKNLEKTLGHPTTCPHGNPIPTKCGGILEEESEPLTNLELDESGTIVKITEEEPDVLRYLAKLGLTLGASVRVEEKIPFSGPIVLNVKGVSRALGRNIASIIRVKKC